jgi:HK97 gp10 family phage protein
MEFVLTGIDAAMHAMRNIDAKVTNENIKPEAARALQPVLETARRIAPVDRGEFRDSLAISDTVSDGLTRDGRGAMYFGPLEDQAFHGWFVELGTVHMAAQPTIVPAFEQHRDEIVDILGKGAGRLILSAN